VRTVRPGGPRRLLPLVALLVAWATWLQPAWASRAVVAWDEPYVNVRAAPGTDATKIGRLAHGAEVEVLETQGEWVHLRYAGGEGWVVERSLERLPEPTVSAVGTAAASGVGGSEAAPDSAVPPAPPQRPGPAPAPAEKTDASPLAAALPPSEPAPPAAASSAPREGYLQGFDQTPPPMEPGPGLISMLSGLLLVLALLAGVVWLIRRFTGHRFPGGRRGNAIRVLATRALGPRQGLLLAETGGLVWLLAQGPEGVRLIAEIRDEAALRRLNEQYGFRDTPFEAQLRRELDLEADESGPHPEPDREPSPEERLAALRRRPGQGEPS